ncbi:MAG TPA: response regulator transcription factor [Stellaceae bacterium]|nr:response regulator transcription factor [Stellaceae bacterium]
MEPNLGPREAVAFAAEANRVRVIIVSAVRFVREGLGEVFERDPRVSTVELCADLFEAAAFGPALDADVVLLDARVPGSVSALRRALDMVPGMRVVVIAVRETEEDIITWAEAGVIGYIPSTAALTDLVRLVIEIHSGEQICSGRVATGLLRRIAMSAKRRGEHISAPPLPALTKRERQAAELITTGLSDKEIARQLNISLATTKSHVHNLLGKLNVQRRSQVADYLREYHQQPR